MNSQPLKKMRKILSLSHKMHFYRWKKGLFQNLQTSESATNWIERDRYRKCIKRKCKTYFFSDSLKLSYKIHQFYTN